MHIQENVSLAPYTTLGIGGQARFFSSIASEDELVGALHFAHARSLPTFVLGGGSNLLVADSGFAGLVLRVEITGEAGLSELDGKLYAEVAAGEDWDHFTRRVCEQGVSGVECLAGIPGLVGASPVQNIGAYGQEVASSIQSVRALDRRAMQFVDLQAALCDFSYRHSIFNSSQAGRYIVTRVNFVFDLAESPKLDYADLAPLRGTHPSPLDVYHAVRAIRDRKGMLIDPGNPHADSRSAGSFFKNPVVPLATVEKIARELGIATNAVQHWPVKSQPERADLGGTVASAPGSQPAHTKLPAAWLIERAGFVKGFRLGPVGISTRHTLALVNCTGTATCAELLTLRDRIVSTVERRFGVRLEQEPVLLA